jgi:hypothetical protein
MSIEGWIQRWKLAEVFYNWQTLIAGGLAVAAAIIAGPFCAEGCVNRSASCPAAGGPGS